MVARGDRRTSLWLAYWAEHWLAVGILGKCAGEKQSQW